MTKSFKAVIEEFSEDRKKYSKEEDVRAGFSSVLKDLSRRLGFNLNLKGHEVFSTHGGSADSVYDNVIFEYKTPNKFHAKSGIDEAVYGRKNGPNDRGLFHYLVNFSLDESKGVSNEVFLESLFSKVGVGFDGFTFLFVRFLS